MWGQIM
jgi:hypothetical protein